MLPLYLFSLLVGGILLAVAAFGGDHGHHGAGDPHADHENGAKFLSLRTLTYFLFVFGGVGSALTWAWKGAASIVVVPLAFVSGVAIAGVVGFTFRYLSRTESGARDTEESFVGLSATVVLPIGAGGLGKVVVQRGDRAYELVARPLDAGAPGSTSWKSVVVVEMNRGTALVAPLDMPALNESP
jgi:hypothetical protein